MKKFIKGCISDFGILGVLCIAFLCVVFSPLLLIGFIGLCIGDFNVWSMTWFDSADEEEENER